MGALCHPTRDAHCVTPHVMRTVSPRTAGPRESRWEIYLRSLLQELLDSVSQRGMTRVPPRPRCALCHPTFEAGPSFGDGRGWSSATQFVSTELYRARVFLDSASWRGMTRVPPRLRCALCHPALDAGSRESRREIYSRSLLQELLDSASQRGMTRGPERVGGRFIYVVSCRNSWIPCRSAE